MQLGVRFNALTSIGALVIIRVHGLLRTLGGCHDGGDMIEKTNLAHDKVIVKTEDVWGMKLSKNQRDKPASRALSRLDKSAGFPRLSHKFDKHAKSLNSLYRVYPRESYKPRLLYLE